MKYPVESHFKWISHLIQSLYHEGVRHVFVSPGSRSTPIALAVASHPGLNTVVVLDERSAAFQALGSAKSSGMPALLICTSGTAPAHYFPAIIEARHTATPMIVLSADRPPSLRQSGSSQTIDQLKLFGDYPVMFQDIGEPVHKSTDIKRLSFLGKQAVETAVNHGGAVHLNVSFRKPLEPEQDELTAVQAMNEQQVSGNSDYKPVSLVSVQSLPQEICRLVNSSSRPVIVAGTDNPCRSLRQVYAALQKKIAAPVIMEPGSNLSNNLASLPIPAVTDDQLRELSPDLIIRFGSTPFTAPIRTFISTFSDVPTIQLLSSDNWQDDQFTVTYRFVLNSDHLALTEIEQKKSDWLDSLSDSINDSFTQIKKHLQDDESLTDGYVMNRITAGLSSSWDVMLSNSFTIRDYALFASVKTDAPDIITNRGAAGIDGIISTASGVARSSGKPLICFTGDLALFHDSNALMALNGLPSAMVIVCINNGGGTIFRMLPVKRFDNHYTDLFETPQQVNIASLAETYGHNYISIRTREQLESLNIDTLASDKVTIIECVTDPGLSMSLRNRVWNRPDS